ncbi:PQ-loop domain-containing transporter [Photobacterium ganghwense]|uniref:PQ-loop domain-containing transporter n=1 Tax=Photobacterium ganghwense TaxID=320778 RepID=UPI001F5D3CCA|nr:PQ-loop domain-containing transporter [Photobacterium ganghwense]
MIAVDKISLVGYGAAICTTCSFIPQVWQVIQSRNTESISLLMYCIFVFGVFLWCLSLVCLRCGSQRFTFNYGQSHYAHSVGPHTCNEAP